MIEDFNNLKDDIREYLDVRLDEIRLHTAESLAHILNSTASIVVIGYLFFFILLFLSFALSYYFADLFNSDALGFITVASLYIVILIVFLLLRKKLVERPIIKAVVKLLFPKLGDDEK
jgi:hypothetical protein